MERDFFRAADPWGFILFGRNVETPGQLSALCASLRDAVGRDAPILIDQEGGRVARLRGPVWREWPDVADHIAATPPGARDAMLRDRYRAIALELSACGVDVNCAPVLDVAAPDCHPFLTPRALGSDAETVARHGRAIREAMAGGGVSAVVKHIPGHGRARVDSHRELPVIEADIETLRAVDFAPFRANADAAMAMTGHLMLPAIDPDACATFSPAVIEVIRTEIGFDGLLMTDDLAMGALSGTAAERAARALKAGCDLVLHCTGDRAEMEAVAEAAPRLAGRARDRADAALAARPGRPETAPSMERADAR